VTPDELSGIVPRWEWRAFGAILEPAESMLAEREVERVQESDEVYLLSRESDASVKIRDDLMDVKLLEAIDDEGLEQWRPVLKTSFPLAAADVRTVLDALAAPPPELARETYTLDELVSDVIEADAALSAVQVHKHRTHYVVDGCMVELSDVTAGRHSTRTIAVEAEDAGLVAATVRRFGFETRPNVCLARGLKTMLGT
jgi:exopolyphosphatase/guanosine-5'-triphosphate,3'-diphosphate pyrophosphatase